MSESTPSKSLADSSSTQFEILSAPNNIPTHLNTLGYWIAHHTSIPVVVLCMIVLQELSCFSLSIQHYQTKLI